MCVWVRERERVCVCVCTHTGLGMFYATLLWGTVGGSFESAMMFHVEEVLGSNQNLRTVPSLNPIAFQEAVEFCLRGGPDCFCLWFILNSTSWFGPVK